MPFWLFGMTLSYFSSHFLALMFFNNFEGFGKFFILHFVSVHIVYGGLPRPPFSCDLFTILVMTPGVLHWPFKKKVNEWLKRRFFKHLLHCQFPALQLCRSLTWELDIIVRKISLQEFVLLATEPSRIIGDKKLSLLRPIHPFLLNQTVISKVIVPGASPCCFTWNRIFSNRPATFCDFPIIPMIIQ